MSEKMTSGPHRLSAEQWLRKWIRAIVTFITYYTGLAFLSDRVGRRSKIRILMYHSIADTPSFLYSVSPTAFEQQMRFLATKYNVISLEQLVDYLKGDEKETLPDRPVIITFDDGWADNYTAAFPILKKYNLPATLFLVPDWIESREAEKRHVTWNQVREMNQNGISIGAHTISHRSLPKLSPEEIRYELVESKARLEAQLGGLIKFFAYPYGAIRDFDAGIARMVAESGYDCAVTVLSGTNTLGQNPYTLRRTEIEAVDGMWVFRKTMAGALDSWILFQWLRWVSQVLKGTA